MRRYRCAPRRTRSCRPHRARGGSAAARGPPSGRPDPSRAARGAAAVPAGFGAAAVPLRPQAGQTLPILVKPLRSARPKDAHAAVGRLAHGAHEPQPKQGHIAAVLRRQTIWPVTGEAADRFFQERVIGRAFHAPCFPPRAVLRARGLRRRRPAMRPRTAAAAFRPPSARLHTD